MHKNSKVTVHTREVLAQRYLKEKVSIKQICEENKIGKSRLYEWIKRYRRGESLRDRSSRPHRIRQKNLSIDLEKLVIKKYQEHHQCGYQKLYLQIRSECSIEECSERDIRKIYQKKDWFKKPERPKVIRYEKDEPGELAHTDLKYLPKIEGFRWYFQELLDDSTRITTVSILCNKKAITARDGLRSSYNKINIGFQAILEDDGIETSYNALPQSKRPKDKVHPVAGWCQRNKIKQKFTKPYRPQTNGKSERLHRTLDDEVLNRFKFKTDNEMFAAIDKWLKWYNEKRIHMGIRMTPLQKMKKLNPNYEPPKSYLTIIR